jgi:hypothetical protein
VAEDRNRLPQQAPGSHEVDAFLDKLARVPAPRAGGARGRLLFAIDATASRQPTWDRASRLQGEMFQATRDLGGLAVQVAYYRGLAEFRATGWVEDSAALVRAMAGVRCEGGETQIERVLRHALIETKRAKVNAVVFVGDAVEEEEGVLAKLAGELGLLGVPLFVFHEGGEPRAAAILRELARLSGGAYCPFDSRSADQLKELLGAVAVYAAGGRRALEDLSRRQGQGGTARRLADQVRLIGPAPAGGRGRG